MGPFRRALDSGVDVIVAGRACDTAIFAVAAGLLGFPGRARRCTWRRSSNAPRSAACPAGGTPILATLDDEGFVLESMNPDRRATPVSVAAHSLYEQTDPFTVREPDGTLDLMAARYEARRRPPYPRQRRDLADDHRSDHQARRRTQDRRACGVAVRLRRSALHRSQCKILPAGRGPWCATGVRGPAEGLHVAIPRLWHRRRAHGRAGKRTPARRGVRHGRMHRAHKRTRRRGGAHHASNTCCTTAIPAGCPPPATWPSPSRRRKSSLGPAYRFNVYHLLHVADADALFPVEIESL